MNNALYVSIHSHCEFSQLDGMGHVKDWVARAKELGCRSLAISDHGNVDCAIELMDECLKQGINPIVGCEAYMVPDMKIKPKGERRGHICLFVQNEEGWSNLLSMLTKANLEGYYRRPRIDFDLLLRHHKGLVITTACVASFLYLEGGMDFFYRLVEERYGENIYLEVMPHLSEEQAKLNRLCRKLSRDTGIPLVATNDAHYINKEDKETHEVLLAIQRGAKWNDPSRWRFDPAYEIWFKDADEMLDGFRRQGVLSDSEAKLAIMRTTEIAKLCGGFRIPNLGISLPSLPIEKSEEEYFRELCIEGRNKTFGDEWPSKEYEDRFEYEYRIITEKKFSRYFIVVKNLLDWCRANNIMTGPRGSAACSLIVHILGITVVDPVKFHLPFDRFINSERIDWPDIDVDIEDVRRDDVKEYLKEKYGEFNVAAISTFLRMKSKLVVRDVGRVFDVDLLEVDKFSKSIRETIDDGLESEEGKAFQRSYPEVIYHAKRLEGQIRGCVSGDSLVYLPNRYGGIRQKKVKNLFKENFKGKIRAYNFEKDILFFDNVVCIHNIGIKKVIQIHVANKKLILTEDHRVLTKRGWINAGDLLCSDRIAINGIPKKDTKFKKGQIPWNKGLKGSQVSWNKGLKAKDHAGIMVHSIRMTNNNPMLNPLTREKMIQSKTKNDSFSAKEFIKKNPICERCGNQASDCHHIDKNRNNNQKENLMSLCHSCHSKLHTENKRINTILDNMTIYFSPIRDINECGEQEVYDIEMESINKNFVCNGIIVHNSSTHAAGIIVSDEDLRKTPRCYLANRRDALTVNWDGPGCEKMGLVKLDLLGLNTLSVLTEAKNLLKSRGIEIDYETLPLDDPNVFGDVSNGHVSGIFQMGYAVRALLNEVSIESIEEWSDVIALARPGPADSGMTSLYIERKNGKEWEPKHPIFEAVTKNTCGVVCLHEDTLVSLSNGLDIPIKKILIGDKLLSVNMENNRVEVDECAGIAYTRFGEGLKVRLSNGYNFTVTGDHEVLTFYGMKRADALDKNDLVAVALCSNYHQEADIQPIANWLGKDEDLAYLIGYIMGNGYLAGCSSSIATGTEEKANKLIEWISIKFPKLNIHKYFNVRSWYLGISCPELANIKGRGNRLTKWQFLLENLGLKKKSIHKIIPNEILLNSLEIKGYFLAGYLDADGFIGKSNNRDVVNVVSSSDILIRQLRRIFVDFGIEHWFDDTHGRIVVYDILRLKEMIGDKLLLKKIESNSCNNKKGKVPSYEIRKKWLMSGLPQTKFSEKTNVARQNFQRNNGFSAGKIGEKVGINLGDLAFYNITDISPVEKQRFYGIGVVRNHNLLGNGVVLKNCFQEQVMNVIHKVAGLPYPVADKIRKIIGKKRDPKEFEQFKDMFVNGCIEQETFTEKEAEEFWDELQYHANYSFNQCLSGSEVIFGSYSRKKKRHFTIEEIYRITNDINYAIAAGSEELHYENRLYGYGATLSMCEDRHIRPNIIKDIYYSGELEVFQLTTECGKTLKCTMNHKLPTPNGTKMLSELNIGDKIFVKGEYEEVEYEKGIPAIESKIASIEYVGIEKCFDVEMEGPNHNFVTQNGIVVSNSHSLSYAIVGYWTAYIRHYYPSEFIAASLTHGRETSKKEIVSEARRLGLDVIPPRIGKSDSMKWICDGKKLYVPFKEIKGIGEKTAIKLGETCSNKEVNKKRKGFFVYNEKAANYPSITGKTRELLERVGAFSLNEDLPPGGEELFDFSMTKNLRDGYPKLLAILGKDFDERRIADALEGNVRGLKLFSKSAKSYKLGKELSECNRCELRAECPGPVYPSTSRNPIMIVGEAPFKDESKQGKPFVGRVSAILWDTLKKFDLMREDFYITNAVKCPPLSSKNPSPSHVLTCRQWLEEEIRNVKPFLILSLGRLARLSLIGEEKGIIKANGTVVWSEEFGAWIVFAAHPGYVNRNKSYLNEFENALNVFNIKIQEIGGV